MTRIATAIVERQFPAGDQFLFVTAREGTGLEVALRRPGRGRAGADGRATGRRRGSDRGGHRARPEGSEAEAAYLRGELASLTTRVRPGTRRSRMLSRRRATRVLAGGRTARRARPDRVPRSPGRGHGDGGASRRATVLRTGGALTRAGAAARPAPPRASAALAASMPARRATRPYGSGGPRGRHRGLPAFRVSSWRTCTWAGQTVAGHALRGTAPRSTVWSSRSGLARTRCSSRRNGLHVLELPHGEDRRVRSLISPTSRPSRAASPGADTPGRARRPTIVRRYRHEPSPLVRDASGTRTGRIDRVLAGDFDLFADAPADQS